MDSIILLVLLWFGSVDSLSLPVNDTRYSFRYLTSIQCTISIESIPYVCYHNEQIDNETVTMITKRLISTSSERCFNNTANTISVAVVVIQRINYINDYSSTNDNVTERCESTMIFVSCDDFYMYKTIGPNTYVQLDARCYYVFNVTEPNTIDECSVPHMFEPKITDYRQILDGTHACYGKEYNYNTNWTIVSIDLFLIIIIIIVILLRCIPLLLD